VVFKWRLGGGFAEQNALKRKNTDFAQSHLFLFVCKFKRRACCGDYTSSVVVSSFDGKISLFL